MTTTESAQSSELIPFEKVKEYADANIPIVPLKVNGNPHDFYLYENDTEKNALVSKLSENIKKHVHAAGYLQPLKLLTQQIPTAFWNDNRIRNQQWFGIGCKTGLTAIPAHSDPSKVLLIIAIDADKGKPVEVLEKLVAQFDFLEKTLVQRTPHGGLHVVFAVAVDPNNFTEIEFWEKKSKLQAICKPDCKIELKSQNMQVTLAPTKHRVDQHLTYTRISKVIAISEEPTFCDELFKALKEGGCLTQTLDEYYASTSRRGQFDPSKPFDKDAKRSDLTETEINTATDIILGRDEENVKNNSPFGSLYVKGERNNLCMYLSGHLYWHHITQVSAEILIRKIAVDSNDGSVSADINKAVGNVISAYKRGDNDNTLAGKNRLIEQIIKSIKDTTESNEEKQQLAEDRLYQLNQALNFSTKRPSKRVLEELEDITLASENVSSDDIQFVIKCIVKEAPDDEEPTKQIFYGMFTAFTKTPMSHNVNSRDSGAGKSYLVLLVGDYFPEKYVLPKNAVSDKAIFHRRGELMQRLLNDKTGKVFFEPIEPKLIELKAERDKIEDKINEEKKKAKKSRNEDELDKFKTELSAIKLKISNLYESAFKMIDLENQVILALDTPQDGFLEALMSIISQDTSRDQEYEFVEKTPMGKIINRINILHGTPCIFTTRTIDETGGLRHEEKTRRLINVTPNTYKEKIKHASDAIISSNCLLPIEYENWIGLSQQDKDRCKHIVAVLVAKLKQHSKLLQPKQTGIRAPFEESIKSAMPSTRDHQVWQMTVSARLTRYLAIVTKLNMDNRWKLIEVATGQFWPISTFDDLKETLSLMKTGASSVRIYQAEFYNNMFLPLYKRLGDTKDTFVKSGNTIITEAVTGFTARKLEEEIKKEYGETISRKALENKLLYPLVNLGILNTVRSQIDGRANLFFPVEDGKIFSLFEDPDNPYFKINNPEMYPDINHIEDSYRFIVNCSHKVGDKSIKNFKLVDPAGNERTVKELVENGLGSPGLCFIRGWESDDMRLNAALRKKRLYELYTKIGQEIKNIDNISPHSVNNLTKIHNNYLEELKSIGEESPKIENQPVQVPIATSDRLKFKELSEKGHSIRQISEIMGISKGACQRHSDYIKSHPEEFTVPTVPLGTVGTPIELTSKQLTIINDVEKKYGVSSWGVPKCTKPNCGTPLVQSGIVVGTPFGTCKQPAITIKNDESLIPKRQLEPFRSFPFPRSLLNQHPKLSKFAAFDTEWYGDHMQENRDKGIVGDLYCFCLLDSDGNSVKLHINQFAGDHYKFMSAILDTMSLYETMMGFSIFSNANIISDCDRIKTNCTKIGLTERFESVKSNIEFLDIQKILTNPVVRTFIETADDTTHRGRKLEDIAQAYIGEGKSEGVTGASVQYKPENEQLDYCFHDAELVYKMIQRDDFELSQILSEISNYINMTFQQTCNAGFPTSWWANKLKSINYQKVDANVQKWIDDNTIYDGYKKTAPKYLGGYVVDPVMGKHLNAASYDVTSMYPTMAKVHNISTETICCECCKDDPAAKVPAEVMQSINDYITDPKNKAKNLEPRPWHYWICRKQRGKFSEIMEDLIQRKIQYKQVGLKLKEKAMKILMNSGYGGFGNAYFEYQDPRVAELITAYGQYTLKKMIEFVGKDIVIYGDTDSIFLSKPNDELITFAKEKLGVKLEKTLWGSLFLTSKKKHYLGIKDNGEFEHVGGGSKSNLPVLLKEIADSVATKEFTEVLAGIPQESVFEYVSEYLHDKFARIQLCDNLDLMRYSIEASKPLYEYNRKCAQKEIYHEILEECGGNIQLANSQSVEGNVYYYWKVNGDNGRSSSTNPQKYELNLTKYKEELFNVIKPILESFGMTKDEISQLYNELVNNAQMMNTLMMIKS